MKVRKLQWIGIATIWITAVISMLTNVSTGGNWGYYSPLAWILTFTVLVVASFLVAYQVRVEQTAIDDVLIISDGRQELTRLPTQSPTLLVVACISISFGLFLAFYGLFAIIGIYYKLTIKQLIDERFALTFTFSTLIVLLPISVPLWLLRPRITIISLEQVKEHLALFQELGKVVGHIPPVDEVAFDHTFIAKNITWMLKVGILAIWVLYIVIVIAIWLFICSAALNIIPFPISQGLFEPAIYEWKIDQLSLIENLMTGTFVLACILILSLVLRSLATYSIGPLSYWILTESHKFGVPTAQTKTQEESTL